MSEPFPCSSWPLEPARFAPPGRAGRRGGRNPRPTLAVLGRPSPRACHLSLLCHLSPFVQNRSLSWNCYDADPTLVTPSPPKRRSAKGSSEKLAPASPRAARLQLDPEGLDTAALAKAAEGSAAAAANRDKSEGTAACS